MYLAWLAGCFTFIREQGGNNRGPWVEALQRAFNGTPGQPWCAYFVCFVLTLYYGGRAPFRMSGGCDELLAAAVRAGRELPGPAVGALFFRLNPKDPTDAEHVGFVVDVHPDGTFDSIEGNTSPPATGTEGSRDGGGVYRHSRMKPAGKRFVTVLPAA
jgi:hypothetical protein